MILIFSGESGAGKDYITKNFINKYPEDFELHISTTTRPIREGEKEGVNYHYISKEEFLKKIEKNEFIEYRSYDTLVNGVADTWYYGTEAFQKEQNKNYVVIKDLEGAKVLKDYCKSLNIPVVHIYISVSDKLREERAKARGSFNQTEWDRRILADQKDFAADKIKDCDYVLTNEGNIDETLQKLEDILNIEKEYEIEPV